MNKAKTSYRSRLLSFSKIVITGFLLLLAFSIPVSAENPNSAQWESDGGETMPSGNHRFTTPSPDTGGVSLEAVADSHVYAYSYAEWNQVNWGKYENLGAGWHPTGGEKRMYLKFDLSGVDPTSVGKATLKLFHCHTGGGNSVDLGVYGVTSPWTEGEGTYISPTTGEPSIIAAPGEISWVNQPSFDPNPVAQFNPGPDVNKWVEVDITPLVQAWLSGAPNNGLMIKAEGNLSGSVPEAQYGFRSREFEDTEKRPVLV
ncbi:MAG: DNRLRE domain-containing protein, partial [Planctomycetes bacterium]|nr:DNRLRE domain-containing protein [Planctomycetota bacterium]